MAAIYHQAVKSIPLSYSLLPAENDNIRLLRLLPNKNKAAMIRCELLKYSLEPDKDTHLYEALSYVWGCANETLPIIVDNHILPVTANLHAALLRLRNCDFARTIWVDAVCINQESNEEKEQQIQLLPKIYSRALRVIVWLGEAADNSDQALKDICAFGSRTTTNYRTADKFPPILSLLQRPWFRRIWILQEVACARSVLIMCGPTEIDGYAFCLGVDSQQWYYNAPADLAGIIESVVHLMKGAIFRPRYAMGWPSKVSPAICPLGELVDMYHNREATIIHDKVFALLNMSSDAISIPGLLPDYGISWKVLLKRLSTFLLGKEVSLDTWSHRKIAVIKSKGCILGEVSSVYEQRTVDGKQEFDISLSGQVGNKVFQRWTAQPTAIPIQSGDLLCLLQGAMKPTIVRLFEGNFYIIKIAPTPPTDIKWREKNTQLINLFIRDFQIYWDWESLREKFHHIEESNTSTWKNDRVSKRPELESKDHIEEIATRIWNVSLILGDLGKYEEAENWFKKAIEYYNIAFEVEKPYMLKCRYGLTPLSWAAGHGYDELLERLLKQDGIDPDLKDGEYGQTPLLWAVEGGHETAVRHLLETGDVDVNAKDKIGLTPLLWGVKGGHEAAVKLLLETGKAGVNVKDRDGRTPLSWAAEGGQEALVKHLLETGNVDVDAKDKNGLTPLLWGVKGGHEAAVKLLLETDKVEIDVKDSDGRTPLWWAAKGGYEAVVKLLLNTGKVEVDISDSSTCRTPLSWAARGGHLAVVKLLLETQNVALDAKIPRSRKPVSLMTLMGRRYGETSQIRVQKRSQISEAGEIVETPLSWAARGGYEAIVKLLLETGKVDVNAKGKEGRTPLWRASGEGHEGVVKLLLATGNVEVDIKDGIGLTPLLWAVRQGREAVAKLLLESGQVQADVKDSNGRTPLSWASEGGHEAVVKLLLETDKIEADTKDSEGRTPLWWAAKGGWEAIVKMLLATKDVDIDVKDTRRNFAPRLRHEVDSSYRRTPLSWAAEKGNEAMVELLLSAGEIDVDAKDSMGQTPLIWAAKGGHESVVKLLIDTYKVEVDVKTGYRQTPLSLAAEGGHDGVAKLLLETGKVDVDAKDGADWTPLMMAAYGGHEAVVKLLLETSKAEVDAKDDVGRTPLSLAAMGKHDAVVKLLLDTGKVDIDIKNKTSHEDDWF